MAVQKDESSKATLVNENALLEEYKSCDELSRHIDRMIWQLASVVFPIALVGLTYFGVSTTHAVEQLAVVIAAGAGSSVLIIAWHFLSNQWSAYQNLPVNHQDIVESSDSPKGLFSR